MESLKITGGLVIRNAANLTYISLKIILAIYSLFPFAYKHSDFIQKRTLFLNFVNIPTSFDPEEYGLVGAQNFYVTTDENVTLGLWQILPEEFLNTTEPIDTHYFEKTLNGAPKIIIFNHGIARSRAGEEYVEFYKILRQEFFVISFDYRGFGDSTNIEPCEEGLSRDSQFVFEWTRNRTSGKIFIWGHSLGSAISIRALADLAKKNIEAAGLVLESPFNNLKDLMMESPMISIFRTLPWYFYTVIEPTLQNNLKFESDTHINKINCPILFLHAEDDFVVPYVLGLKLYENVTKSRMKLQAPVKFIGFEEEYGYGHQFITNDPSLTHLIRDFIKEALLWDEISKQ